MQAVCKTLAVLPIPTDIYHMKGHQDQHKAWEELNESAQINVLANWQANAIHVKSPTTTGIFPNWVSGTHAALFHGNRQVTSSNPAYIHEAKHAPEMKQYLIQQLTEATRWDKSWNAETY